MVDISTKAGVLPSRTVFNSGLGNFVTACQLSHDVEMKTCLQGVSSDFCFFLLFS